MRTSQTIIRHPNARFDRPSASAVRYSQFTRRRRRHENHRHHHAGIPLATAKPITNGKHTYTHVNFAVVEIATDDGITGIGLGNGGASSVPPSNTSRRCSSARIPSTSSVSGTRCGCRSSIGRRGLTTRAIAALDIGLWDIRAKAANLPLYKMLGGFRDRVPTYIAGGYYEEGNGLHELAREMEDNVRMGAKAVKMKIGGVPIAEDVARVCTAREAIGPDVKLMVDANCAYRYYEAIQIARRIEDYDIFWFEEPVMPDDYDGHRKLAQATSSRSPPAKTNTPAMASAI